MSVTLPARFQYRDWNTCLAKKKAKPLWSIGISGRVAYIMKTTQEVLNELSSREINISERTLQDWAKKGLIPKPDVKAGGRGKGRTCSHQDDTPYEGYASAILMRVQRLRPEVVARAREKALTAASKITGPVVDYIRFIRNHQVEGDPDETLWYRWLDYKLMAQDPSGATAREFDKRASLIFDALITSNRLLRAGIDEDIEKRIQEMTRQVKEEDQETFIEMVKSILSVASKNGKEN